MRETSASAVRSGTLRSDHGEMKGNHGGRGIYSTSADTNEFYCWGWTQELPSAAGAEI